MPSSSTSRRRRAHLKVRPARLVFITDESIVVDAAAKIRDVPFRCAGKLTVCQTQELQLSRGDRLQLKANAKAIDGKRLMNGELVTVERVKPMAASGLMTAASCHRNTGNSSVSAPSRPTHPRARRWTTFSFRIPASR